MLGSKERFRLRVSEALSAPNFDGFLINGVRVAFGIDIFIVGVLLQIQDANLLLPSYVAANAIIRAVGSRRINRFIPHIAGR